MNGNDKKPQIRFKEFQNAQAWEQRKLGDCVLIQRGGSPRPIESFLTTNKNGINWIKIGDVSPDSRYITHTKEKIIPEGVQYSRKVYAGDLILSNSMSFGRPYILAIDGCIHDGWLLIRNEAKIFDLEYLLQVLSSEAMLAQYKALASGGVVNNLNSELVQSTMIYVPKLEEQQKIGSYFTTLDRLITLHQRMDFTNFISTNLNSITNALLSLHPYFPVLELYADMFFELSSYLHVLISLLHLQ